MRVFKNAWFARFARKERIADKALHEAIHRAELGLIDADLGGGLIKQRIPRPGQGKSGGYRSMVLFRRSERALFVFGFAKRNMDNVEDDEIEYFKKMAREVLALNDEQLALLIVKGLFEEVKT